MKFIKREFLLFVLVGAVNTGASYLLYLGLLSIVSTFIAYTISFVAGIALGYALNTLIVFRERVSVKKAAQFPIVYLVQYGLGIGLLYVFTEWLHISRVLAPLLILVVSVPITFFLARAILRGGSLRALAQQEKPIHVD
jgi:putative flippase GtrA